jgi:hypothetical protein
MLAEERAREMLAESGIPEPGSTRLLDSLTELGFSVDEIEPPQPGPELASLMARASRGTVVPFRRRSASLAVAAAVTLGTVGAGGLAAAANELPHGAQDLVAKFSEQYLPFELPRPDADRRGSRLGYAPSEETPKAAHLLERETGSAGLASAGEPAVFDGLDDALRKLEPSSSPGPKKHEAFSLTLAPEPTSAPSQEAAPAQAAPPPAPPAPAPAPEAAPEAAIVVDSSEVAVADPAATPEAVAPPVTEPQAGGASRAAEQPPPSPSAGTDVGTSPEPQPRIVDPDSASVVDPEKAAEGNQEDSSAAPQKQGRLAAKRPATCRASPRPQGGFADRWHNRAGARQACRRP